MILDIGKLLYVDSYIAYGPADKKLGMENVMRKFQMDKNSIHITVYKPIVSGMFFVSNIMNILQVYFQQETYCVLSYMNQWVSLFFKSGLFYMFDSNACDLNAAHVRQGESGSAVLVKFNKLDNLASKLFDNLFIADEASARMFNVWLVDVDIRDYDVNKLKWKFYL